MKCKIAAGSRVYAVEVAELRDGLRIVVDGQVHVVRVAPWVGTTHLRAVVDGRSIAAAIRRSGDDVAVVIGPEQHRLRVTRHLPIPQWAADRHAGSGSAKVIAPMPGLVVSVETAVGARVEQGTPIVIMEAMKMQMEVRAPAAGAVASVTVRPGQEVATGTLLATIDAENHD